MDLSALEQDWLLEELAALVRARGPEPFLRAPLVEPSARLFPRGGDALAGRRLLSFVGLGHLAVLTRTDSLGELALEVARAYRAHHHLVHADPGLEDDLAEVTAVYLGFGLLRARSGARVSFLLAAQVVARGLDEPTRARIADALGTAAAGFRAACTEFDRDGVLDRLDVQSTSLALGDRRVVFRRARTDLTRFVLAGLTLGAILGGVALLTLGVVFGFAVLAAVFLTGVLIGLSPRDTCSRRDCGAPLPRRATTCPRCGGRLLGRLEPMSPSED